MQKLRVRSIAIKRGTMRVRAEAVNLRARGNGSAEHRATETDRSKMVGRDNYGECTHLAC
jgi:hypothetical protein